MSSNATERKTYSPAELRDEVLRLRGAGVSPGAIARLVGRSQRHVHRILRDNRGDATAGRLTAEWATDVLLEGDGDPALVRLAASIGIKQGLGDSMDNAERIHAADRKLATILEEAINRGGPDNPIVTAHLLDAVLNAPSEDADEVPAPNAPESLANAFALLSERERDACIDLLLSRGLITEE